MWLGSALRAATMPIAKETHVVTARGLFPIANIAGSAYALLADGGRWVDAPITSFGTKPIMEVTLSRSRVIKTIRATPDHRWLLRTYSNRRFDARTVDLFQGCLLPGTAAQHGCRQAIRGSRVCIRRRFDARKSCDGLLLRPEG